VTHTSPSRLRLSPLVEVAALAGLALGLKALISLFAWEYAGPISLLMILTGLTVYFRTRGLGWSDFGLIRLPSVKSWLLLLPQALLGVIAILATGVLTAKLGTALGFEFMSERPEGVNDRWAPILEGSWPHYLLWISLSIFSAGFGEEMFFRGYLINRINDGLGRSILATAVAIVLPALLFGYGHMYYQGLRGLITTGMIAITLGVLFIAYRRNLWPLIIAHAAVDCLVFSALFFDFDI